MPSLRELQQGFADALLAPDGTPPGFAIAGPATGGERIAIYRTAMYANYRKALGATYVVVRRLVGDAFFHAAVDEFVRTHASASGDLNLYGDAFGDFLAAYPYARHLGYLPDVARLEWAIDEAQRAADAPLAPDAVLATLAAAPPDRQPALRLRLNPSCRLLASAFPILRVWQVNQADDIGEERVDLDAGGDRLLVRRDANGVTIRQLPPGEHALLAALAADATLADALGAAAAADAGFDLGAALRAHISGGTIVGVRDPEAGAQRAGA